MNRFTTKASVHSLNEVVDVVILHYKNNNDVLAEYNGKRCTAIYNPFVELFYVDDIYGILQDQHRCPVCGEYIE